MAFGTAPAQDAARAGLTTARAAHAAGGLALDLDLEPSSDLLGWGARIAAAQLLTGRNRVGLEERVADGGLDWHRALGVVEGLCGSCSQANLLAFCQAVEAASRMLVPPRAAYLRMVLVEIERITSHLTNADRMLDALSLHDRAAIMRDLRERMVHATAEWTGARMQPAMITYGGLVRNMDEMASRSVTLAARNVERALRGQVSALINSREVAGRLAGLGTITPSEALVGSLRGPVARASGLAVDLRVTWPTGAYEDEAVTIVAQRNGDAFSRLVVRLLECLESFRVIEQALDDLPSGPVRVRAGADLREGVGISRMEGPRGEVFCWIQGAPEGLRGLHLSTGSQPTLGIVPGLLRGTHLDDADLLLLSLDICLACAER
jgi:Ni,Fe-hydrogenase III large subunit